MAPSKKTLGILLAAAVVISFGIGVAYGEHLAQNTQEDVFEASIVAEADNDVVVVDLKGAVQSPGLYHLAEGSRVGDILEQAVLLANADTSSLNLARKLTDGEMIEVSFQNEISPEKPSTDSSNSGTSSQTVNDTATSSDSARININSASLEQLETLPGIGPAKASAIINYRTDHGPFSSIEEIKKVSGIGEATYANLKELISVD